MKLTANISLDELIKSQVAERKGINNNPSPMQIENLKALAINILQPIRSEFDRPLIISSGFRTAELCIEIGSKITSEHCADNKSAAADFEIPGIDNKVLAQWIRDNLFGIKLFSSSTRRENHHQGGSIAVIHQT
jgi:zinc D-Ala-D-Ala carboxypeptidase